MAKYPLVGFYFSCEAARLWGFDALESDQYLPVDCLRYPAMNYFAALSKISGCSAQEGLVQAMYTNRFVGPDLESFL